MTKKIILSAILVIVPVFGMMIIGCKDSNDEIIKEPRTVQQTLNRTVVEQESASSAEFQSASYDQDLGYIILTYKIGTIKE